MKVFRVRNDVLSLLGDNGGVRMRSYRELATTLTEANLGAGPKISKFDIVPIGSKCRFRIGASQAVVQRQPRRKRPLP
ncbi:hypothetical protein Taro_028752 [Colocasia esculenta]|uniref:Uncharacterized protein n=1 Tax=Colocasia esculenta TaxID=4460 RepID=A0A843VH89_COLES|nr:hypothetical protein [Colocasia esculenta]